MTPEGRVKNAVCSYLASRGVFFFVHASVGIFDSRRGVYRTNHSPHHRRGVADLLGIYHGAPLAVELKSAKGRLSPYQKQFLDDWKAAGGIAIVARSIDDVIEGLKTCPHCATPKSDA